MIILIPTGGLGNRMRSIDSALNLSRQTDHTLIVYWRKDSGLNCDFHALFCQIQGVKIHSNIKILSFIFRLKKSNRVFNLFFGFLETLNIIKLIDQDEFKYLMERNSKFQELKRFKILLLRSYSGFYQKLPYLKDFLLRPDLLVKASEITSKFKENTIGVHIRRTDNIDSILNSPVELFELRMEEELTTNPDTNFFLATDSEEMKELMVSKFGHLILFCKENANRNSHTGIRQAAVELYSLSATKKILGSYWSSFSETASQLGNIPLEIIKASI